MKKTLIRIGCFAAILSLILILWNNVFKLKDGDGIYGMTTFYEQEKDTVDVLFLGSSHAFENINTGTLWDEYGMSSYVLGGAIQPMWNTYAYLKEALKTQHPKLIVLEAYCTILADEYNDDGRIILNNFGLHLSPNKVEALMESVPPERWSEFFLEYTQYHSRYRELSESDFLPDQGNPLFRDWKGFASNLNTEPLAYQDITGVKEADPLTEKTETWYRKVIELILEKEIPLAVIISPYPGIAEDEQRKFNTAEKIAAEYDVPFMNFNFHTKEIGLDYSVDAGDISHLNYRGNPKYTRYLGDYLDGLFEIPDHRGDPKYASWQRNADFIRQMISDQEMADTENPEALFQRIRGDQLLTFVSVDGACTTSDHELKGYLEAAGITEEGQNGIWAFEGDNCHTLAGPTENELYQSLSSHDIHLKRALEPDEKTGEPVWKNSMVIDNTDYVRVKNGINVVVFDRLTEKVVDSFGINAEDGYSLVRKGKNRKSE